MPAYKETREFLTVVVASKANANGWTVLRDPGADCVALESKGQGDHLVRLAALQAHSASRSAVYFQHPVEQKHPVRYLVVGNS
jgi:hypothetical protein